MKSFLVYTLSLHKCAIAGLSITCMRVWVSFSGLIILHFSYNHYGPSVSCWSTLCTDFFPLFALSTLLTVLSTSPSIFLCMLLLNVPSTWWPLCVNSQMQLKVVCVFVLFFCYFTMQFESCMAANRCFIVLSMEPWTLYIVTIRVYIVDGMFIVQTHHDNGYRCNFTCFMSFIRLFIIIFFTEFAQATPAFGLRFDGFFCGATRNSIFYTLLWINDEKLLNISR